MSHRLPHARSLPTREGFTLVEIMIVVAIVGLLAALAIPAWQKVRLHTIASTMDNDARQLGAAAQQYFMEYGVSTVSVTYTAGAIAGPLADRVHFIGTQYTVAPTSLSSTATFSLGHAAFATPRTYDAEGHYEP